MRSVSRINLRVRPGIPFRRYFLTNNSFDQLRFHLLARKPDQILQLVRTDFDAELGQNIGLRGRSRSQVRRIAFSPGNASSMKPIRACRRSPFRRCVPADLRPSSNAATHAIDRLNVACSSRRRIRSGCVCAISKFCASTAFCAAAMRFVIRLAFDGYIFFHAETQHQVLHALAAEDAHQVILER